MPKKIEWTEGRLWTREEINQLIDEKIKEEIVPLKLELKKIREETNRSSKAYEEYKARKEKQLNNNEYYQKYLEYIKINGCLIKNVPKEYITQELCELAVKQNGVALKWVPEELRTFDMCEIALNYDPTLMQYVPEEFKTYELCKVALANKWVAK